MTVQTPLAYVAIRRPPSTARQKVVEGQDTALKAVARLTPSVVTTCTGGRQVPAA
jgi:hypothetical protein